MSGHFLIGLPLLLVDRPPPYLLRKDGSQNEQAY